MIATIFERGEGFLQRKLRFTHNPDDNYPNKNKSKFTKKKCFGEWLVAISLARKSRYKKGLQVAICSITTIVGLWRFTPHQMDAGEEFSWGLRLSFFWGD